MARPRTAPREGDRFVTICPRCKTKRLLKNNPGKRRNAVCTSCLRTGTANVPGLDLPPRLVERYLNGASATQLAAELGTTPNAVLRALRRQGVDCRGMSEAVSLLGNSERLRSSLDALRETGELAVRLSAGHQGIPATEWRGFRTDFWDRVRSSAEWDEWRRQVYARDAYRCVVCGATSTRGNALEPHHIHKKSTYPERMFDVENGVTLCATCHRVVTGQEEAWAPLFEALLS